MLHRDANDDATPLLPNAGAWIALTAALALGALIVGIVMLDENGLAPSTAEMEWAKWQLSPKADVQGLVDDTTQIVLTRTACMGSCPEYEVELLGSGSAKFTGHAYVCEKTPEPVPLERMQLARVVGGIIAVSKAEAFDFPYPGPDDVTYTTISLRNSAMYISTTFPSRNGPRTRLLDTIADQIDAVAGSSNWLGERHDHTRMCRKADGTLLPVSLH